jgi:hypothetical protein
LCQGRAVGERKREKPAVLGRASADAIQTNTLIRHIRAGLSTVDRNGARKQHAISRNAVFLG